MKDNKLIAEFMGFQKTNIGWYDSEETMPPLSNTYDSNTFDEHELAFHKSWDWLMPVVEKIESLGYDVIIRQGTCEIRGEDVNGVEYDNFECFDSGKHKTTYSAIVKFIKEYNETK